MSRTYRRTKNYNSNWFSRKDSYCSTLGPLWPYQYELIPIPKDTEEYARKSAYYHSDAYTHECKEPGPAWFRNLYTERPQRRFNKNELRKYMLNEDYEPMCIEMDKLPW